MGNTIHWAIMVLIVFISEYIPLDTFRNETDSLIQKANVKDSSSLAEIPNIDSALFDSLICPDLITAKYYEINEEFDKAFEYYIKAYSCEDSISKSNALEGIYRVYSHKDTFIKQTTKLVLESFKYVTLFIAIFILLRLIKYFYPFVRSFLKKWFKLKQINIDIQFINDSDENNEYITQFKLQSEVVIQKFRIISELKSSLSSTENNSTRPEMRTRALSSAFTLSAEIVAGNYFSILSKIFDYLFPSDYIIYGETFKENENARYFLFSVIDTLDRSKGHKIIFEKIIPNQKFSEGLYELSYEILIYIRNKNGSKS